MMRANHLPVRCAMFFAAVTSVNVARADVMSTFDTSLEGWTLANGGDQLTWSATLGNPGGGISGNDSVSNRLWYFVAPSVYLGNQSHAIGGSLTWDRQNLGGTGAAGAAADVILESATLRIGYAIPGNIDLPTWQTFSVPLSFTGWYIMPAFPGTPPTGTAVTEAQFESVLSSLTGLYIQGEYRNGNDTGVLDNVIMRLRCDGDYDQSGDITSNDFFAFLTDFFADNADFNNDGVTTSGDFFAFLSAYFQGC